MTGKVGEGYEVVRQTFDGYRLDEDHIPANETGTYSEDGDTVEYKYILLRPYELEVRYITQQGETSQAKIAVDFGDTHVEDYTTNGVLKVEDVELTDVGTTTYSIHEVEIPAYYDSIAGADNPAEITLTRRLNEEENKYEFVPSFEQRTGLNVRIDEENKKVIISLSYVYTDCNYKVEFYYDEVLKEEETLTIDADYGDVIEKYEAPEKEGYMLDTTREGGAVTGLPLTITEGSNVIRIYYAKISAPVVVKYVDNLTGEEIKPSTTMTGKIGTSYEVQRQTFAGYKLDEDNLPTNEIGTYSEEGDTVVYTYIELKSYEVEVRYTAGEDEIDEAKISVDFGDQNIEDYTTNGILKIEDVELTDLGTMTYTIIEKETPEYCKTIAGEENPMVVELTRRLNEEANKYEFVPNYEERDGFNVIIDEENKKVIFDFTTIKNEKYDLALRKFISKIGNSAVTDREPKVSIAEDGKIIYTENNEIEKASNGEEIVYTIRMYNESDVRARGKQVIEYVPEGLVFVPENEVNKSFKWTMCKVDENGNVTQTENAEEANMLITDFLDGQIIDAVKDEKVSYLDVQAVFKVDETKVTSEDRIVENKVKILPNKNDDNTENDVTTEKLYVKYFDLSIEKYIENVKINKNGNEETVEVGYDNKDSLVKVDIKRSEQKTTKLTVTYGLLIKNVGEIPGYATEITDYIPENFELVSSDEWTVEDNKAVTKSLENVLLNPGESKTVEITFEWELLTGTIGSRINEAKITEYVNEYNAKDVTEDNNDNEEILVTVKTGSEIIKVVGQITLYIGLVALAVLTIKKKVVIKK